MRLRIGFGATLKAILAPIGRLALGAADAVESGREMPIPGVHIECRRNPILYSQEQIEDACWIAYMLQRGKLVLLVEPEGPDREEDDG